VFWLESVIGFDGVIRVLRGDVARGGYQVIDHSRVRGSPVVGHLRRAPAVLDVVPRAQVRTVSSGGRSPTLDQRVLQPEPDVPRSVLTASPTTRVAGFLSGRV
jgi:hypothetical protein